MGGFRDPVVQKWSQEKTSKAESHINDGPCHEAGSQPDIPDEGQRVCLEGLMASLCWELSLCRKTTSSAGNNQRIKLQFG